VYENAARIGCDPNRLYVGGQSSSIRDEEYGASLDLQQLYPFWTKFRFVEVGPVEAENPPRTDTEA
jgi:hypothetical protein